MSINSRALWQQCLELIKDNVNEQQFNAWFRSIQFGTYRPATKTLLVQVPSMFVYEYLEENYGLTVNKEDYLIVYDLFAENQPPQIKVIYQGGKQ